MSRLRAGAWLAPWLLAGCQTAPTHEQITREHLTAIVVAQAPQCLAVEGARREQRFEYRVVCQTGDVFRVRVTDDGQVRVTAVAP